MGRPIRHPDGSRTSRSGPSRLIHAGQLVAVASVLSLAVSGLAAPIAGASSAGQLKIAAIAPLSGATATLGKLMEGPCAGAVTVVNHGGGVLGHKLSCYPVNDLGDPADAVANVSKALATTSGIVGAIGLTSATAATEVPILNSAKIPMVSQNGLSEFTTRFYPYFWRMTPPDRVGGAAIGLAAARLGFKSAAVIIQNSTANTGTRPGIIAALKKKGVKVVTNLLIPGDAASYDTVVNRIKNDKPGGLVISADTQTTLTLLSEYKSLNSGKVPPVVVPTGILGTGFFHGVKKLMGGSYLTRSLTMVGTFVDQSSPAFKQYASAVKHTSIGATEAEAILATQAIGTIYDGIIVMSLAMDAAHSTTPAVYNKYMPKVTKARKGAVVVHSYAQGAKELKAGHQIQYVGVTGPVAFDKLHNSSGEFASFTYAANGSVKTGKILGPKTLAPVL
jgi:branched-chain amino acid transport system substrate-binding protein